MSTPHGSLGPDVLAGGGSIPPAIQTPSVSPDVYVAGLAAATQVYIDRAMIRGRPTAAAIDALVRQPASKQKLTAEMTAAIHAYLLTSPDASGVVAQSAVLGTRVFAYTKARGSTPTRGATRSGTLDSRRPARPVALAHDGGTGGSSTGPQQLTAAQAVAAARAANQAAPEPIHDPPLEPDELGNLLLSFGFGIGALGEDLVEGIVNELGSQFFTNLDDTIITTLSPNDAEPPDLSDLKPPDDGEADLPDQATSPDGDDSAGGGDADAGNPD